MRLYVAACLTLLGLGLSLWPAPAQSALRAPNERAQPIEQSAAGSVFNGSSSALSYDVSSTNVTYTPVENDDVTLPTSEPFPTTPILIASPVNPPDTSFARIEFNDGTSYCSATAIGRRTFLTAGHCVADETTGNFRQNAIAYLGFPLSDPNLRFRAVRFVAFSGWTTVRDKAHDVALVVVDRDLPASTALYSLAGGDPPNCYIPHAFDRHYYQGADRDQLAVHTGHFGCAGNQLIWAISTTRGSSGSAAVRAGTHEIYGVYSNFQTTPHTIGSDAWITKGKACYINSVASGRPCQPPPEDKPTTFVLESAHIDVVSNAGFVDVAVYRSGSLRGTYTLRYATIGLSALPGRDYDNTEGILTWAEGDAQSKSVRVRLHDTGDWNCERQLIVSFANRQPTDSNPGLISGPASTNVNLVSARRPLSERRLFVQQLLPASDTPYGPFAYFVLQPGSGQDLYSAGGYDIMAYWRDAGRGVLRYRQLVHDPVGGYVSPPVLSSDGANVIRITGGTIKVYTRSIGSPDLVLSSTVPPDYERYDVYDITAAPDARSDVYVASRNNVANRVGILRYQRNSISGALSDKQSFWTGDGGSPKLNFILSIRVSQDGRWLYALHAGGLLVFRRDGQGLLSFVEQQAAPFGGAVPTKIAQTPDGKYLFVSAEADDRTYRIHSFLVDPVTGRLALLSTRQTGAADMAVNPDGKELYVLSGDHSFEILQYAIDGTTGGLSDLGHYASQSCLANVDLRFVGRSLSVGPEGRLLTVGGGDTAIAVLRLDR